MIGQAVLRCFNEDVQWTRRSKGNSSLQPEKQTTHSLSSVRISMPRDGKTRGTRGADNTSSAVLFYVAGHSMVDGQIPTVLPSLEPGDTIKDGRGKSWTVMAISILEGLRGEYRHIEAELR